jgi:adenylylsulfate kinase-like enzyme
MLSKRRILGSRDGLDLKNASSFIRRSDVVQYLENKVFEQRAILVRAPPASGKTSIAQLLYLHLFESYMDSYLSLYIV